MSSSDPKPIITERQIHVSKEQKSKPMTTTSIKGKQNGEIKKRIQTLDRNKRFLIFIFN